MANYKMKYFMEFDTIISLARVRVEFHKKGYLLSRVHRLKGVGDDPLTINYQGEDTLRSAEITIKFLVTDKKREGLKNFWSATERDWKVIIYVNDVVFLESFLLVTDHSTEPMTDDNYVLTLKATDGLGLLDTVDFKSTTQVSQTYISYNWSANRGGQVDDTPKTITSTIDIANNYLNGFYPFSELLAKSLSDTLLCSEINEFTNIYEEGMVTNLSPFFQSLVHLSKLKDTEAFVKTDKVLKSILDTFCQICFQKNGKWVITSLAELSKGTQKGRKLDMVYGSLLDSIQTTTNDLLEHSSRNTRFYFVDANAIGWYVAPIRKILAKLEYKPTLNLLKNPYFLFYDSTNNLFGFWNKVGTLAYTRLVVEGVGNVVRISGKRSQAGTGSLKSETIVIPPRHTIEIKLKVRRYPWVDGSRSNNVNTNSLPVKIEIANQGKSYILYRKDESGNVNIMDTNILLADTEFKGNVLKKATSKVGLVDINQSNYSLTQANFYNNFVELHTPYKNGIPRIIASEFVEYSIILDDVTALGDYDSQLNVSFRCPDINYYSDVGSVEVFLTNQDSQITGERIELTNDEESKVAEKSIDLVWQDAAYEYESHALINGRNNQLTKAWRRLGREEGKSLGELTAEMMFNSLINHRPFFETNFKTRTAPYNYGDTFTYDGMKYLPQDYEYNVKLDEIRAKIIRPIGDCDYNHKAEFFDIIKDSDDALVLTKRYVIDSSACADVTNVEPEGQYFDFSGLIVDDNLWREAENAGVSMDVLPEGQYFEFGLIVDDNLWREAENAGVGIDALPEGQFFEFGYVIDDNLWREAETTGDNIIALPEGQYFEFEVWQEAENAGLSPDFSSEDFSNDFDIIE